MPVRRIALIASMITASLSLVASPMLAVTPDIGYRVSRSDPASPTSPVAVSPWVWEPDMSDALRIAVGSRTRRIVIRVWAVSGVRQGYFVEQARPKVGAPWRTTIRIRLSLADLAGGNTDPARTVYERRGFLSFDANTLSIEDNGGLAYTVVAPADRALIIRFGARDARTGAWTTLTRFANR